MVTIYYFKLTIYLFICSKQFSPEPETRRFLLIFKCIADLYSQTNDL